MYIYIYIYIYMSYIGLLSFFESQNGLKAFRIASSSQSPPVFFVTCVVPCLLPVCPARKGA